MNLACEASTEKYSSVKHILYAHNLMLRGRRETSSEYPAKVCEDSLTNLRLGDPVNDSCMF